MQEPAHARALGGVGPLAHLALVGPGGAGVLERREHDVNVLEHELERRARPEQPAPRHAEPERPDAAEAHAQRPLARELRHRVRRLAQPHGQVLQQHLPPEHANVHVLAIEAVDEAAEALHEQAAEEALEHQIPSQPRRSVDVIWLARFGPEPLPTLAVSACSACMDLLVLPAFVVAPRVLLGVRLIDAPALATLASAAVVAGLSLARAGAHKLRPAVAGLVLGTPAFYVAAVLAGAPFGGGAGDNPASVPGADTLHSLGTLAWAALAAAVVAAPTAANLGGDFEAWHRVILRVAPATDHELRVASSALVGVFGAWVSAALFVPLDWGSAWLQWPLPIAYGLVVGHCAGSALGFVWGRLQG